MKGNPALKKLIEKFNDYRYRKRLKKWATVNIKFALRKTKRFFKSARFKNFIKSVPFITGCAAAACIAALCVMSAVFTKFVCPFFDSNRRIISRLTMTEFDDTVPYLRSLYALGSSNRIQVTLKTDDENYINPRGVGLDRGGVNLRLTFSDGNTTEFALSNANYDNFESGMTDTFTLILPFGYTPFDITEYTIAVLPDINNNYDEWHCRWARVYFLLGNEPMMLAGEDWEDVAVFGGGEHAVKQSTLKIVHGENNKYNRTKQIYSYYLSLAQKGATELMSDTLKSDALDSLGLNGGKFLYLDIETANIQIQNNILTYYTKGVDIPEIDSLDYDGRLFLDVTFFSEKPDGGYTESFLLDTLGTDDFELGTTSSFKLEMPEGMCVFDISSMSIRVENPYDSWAPHYIRAYIKPDYSDKLEIARLNDTMLINGYSTPVFYKNLIDTGVELDLSAKFSIAEAVKKKIESENEFKFGEKISDMYFKLQSFYERQNVFFEQAVALYAESVYEDVPQGTPDAPEEPAVPDTDDGVTPEEINPDDENEADTETAPETNSGDTPTAGKPTDTETETEADGSTQTDNPSQTPENTDNPSDTDKVQTPTDETGTNSDGETGGDSGSAGGDTPDSSQATEDSTESSEDLPDNENSSDVWNPSGGRGQNTPSHQIWDVQEDIKQ